MLTKNEIQELIEQLNVLESNIKDTKLRLDSINLFLKLKTKSTDPVSKANEEFAKMKMYYSD